MKIYLIAGGTASGKTTIAKKVWESILTNETINLIQLDDYYFPFSVLKQKYNISTENDINWDDPITINFSLLKEHLEMLRNGHEVRKAKFIYETNEYSQTEFSVYSNFKNTIIEGIHALFDEEIVSQSSLKIYVHADADLRLIRRIKRDSKERRTNFNSEQFLINWETKIRKMHNKYIEPTKYQADLIISTNNWIERKFNLKVIDIIKDSILEED